MTEVKLEMVLNFKNAKISEQDLQEIVLERFIRRGKNAGAMPYTVSDVKLTRMERPLAKREKRVFSLKGYNRTPNAAQSQYAIDFLASLLVQEESLDRIVYSLNVKDILISIVNLLGENIFKLNRRTLNELIDYVEAKAFEDNSGMEDIEFSLLDSEAIIKILDRQNP
ncbi:hypothetical protein [Metabacillus fastidiosus]|uniref:Uncharacterized protein n=1 Tax=Metabacillus fastidiosus TaxID=1458 RepID=A0ABU6NT23_9BACI|nr:hypothetical protein [Metabacillus fastidiosus]MED4400296.1 hypothetical protein [Metabacillus fastidiosus]